MFLGGNFFDFDICLISPQNACLRYVLCGKPTAFFSLSPKYTVQNPFWNKQACPKFINVILENNLSHISGAKSTVWNVAMKVSPLSSHIFIWICTFYFSVTWCPSATSIYLSLSYNDPRIKYEPCGLIWHVAPESKIQLVNCKLSPRSLLELLPLPKIRAIYAYIYCLLSFSLLLDLFAIQDYPFCWNGIAFIVSYYI